MTVKGISPASRGPAGSHFEGQVGAHYLLSMLTGSEARGLPTTIIDRVEFQRAGEGRPLDDVVIHAHEPSGEKAILEIQVKRTIEFSPADQDFRAVAIQIAQAAQRPDFWTTRYELAVATAKMSRKIAGAYQDVLTWARKLGSAETFMSRIERAGAGNNDMRTFVHTFKTHLTQAGCPGDAETIWSLLRRLHILVFDFTAQDSQSELLEKERATAALTVDDAQNAVTLWKILTELSLDIALSGGDRTRDALFADLKPHGFRFAGTRRYAQARSSLGEASQAALDDIRDQVGEIVLTRPQLMSAVHSALDTGSYVEIRGDAGVGKSGILKHFATQMAREGQIVVLNPNRTTPGGWLALRASLGFDGSLRDILVDLAATGGATLFLDNLDDFSDEARPTVIDLVRNAAGVPGFSVIATARRNVEGEDTTWLPLEALQRLGRAAPIVVGELEEVEISELSDADPNLAILLANNHRAREVTRNLFRLSRLAGRPKGEVDIRTEIDMAEQWWQTADGPVDNSRAKSVRHRERSRVLQTLAEQALLRAAPLDVSQHKSEPIEELIASGTLQAVGHDRVAFRHDVFREWAIASLLFSNREYLERLPLDRPASPALARGLELFARMTLERSQDLAPWESLLDHFSRSDINGSWQRNVLLALVRSEAAVHLLPRVSSLLMRGDGELLRRLIRIVMAVDVMPAAPIYAAMGLDVSRLPADYRMPSGPSYFRLVRWLLDLGESLPQAAIQDAIALYNGWCLGTFGRDPLTPQIVAWYFNLLTKIYRAQNAENFRERRSPFGNFLDETEISSLESELRTTFLMFCDHTPQLAAQYLNLIRQLRRPDGATENLLKFRGMLAKAAPAELAEFTLAALIPAKDTKRHRERHDGHAPFTFAAHAFLPASPAQGPFYELLTHSPPHGLMLIRRLVDCAISFHADNKPEDPSPIRLSFPDGERAFHWWRTYNWSRAGGGHHVVTCALMALEAWAHKRVEHGETLDVVLTNVLGSSDAPAAYLLIAVDLLLSHWPKSREALVPFVSSPELLCLDRQRYVHDKVEFPDVLGLKDLQREPQGAVDTANLENRSSRRCQLYDALCSYALGPDLLRERIEQRLHQEAVRLGVPVAQATLSDPALMTSHALNLIERKNWVQVNAPDETGVDRIYFKYIAPEAEQRHFDALQNEALDRSIDVDMEARLSLAVDDASRSSPEFADAAVAWAQKLEAKIAEEDSFAERMRQEAIVTAAMIAVRDGKIELREQAEPWVRSIFTKALSGEEEAAHRLRQGLRFNPIAIAYAGTIMLLRYRAEPADIRSVLEVAASGNTAAAQGFACQAEALDLIDIRLRRSILRCAFSASIRPHRKWDQSEEENAARSDQLAKRAQEAVNAELTWLAGVGIEPAWPVFPETSARRRRGIRLPGGIEDKNEHNEIRSRADKYVDYQATALWLQSATASVDIKKHDWIRELVRKYSEWTSLANGAGFSAHERVDNPPHEWNNIFFDLSARCLPGLTVREIDELTLKSIAALPDEPFLDAVTQFLRSVDTVYFGDRGLEISEAVHIRSVLAERLMSCSGWRALAKERSSGIEIHLGPAIAVFFFNDYNRFQSPSLKAYLLPKGIDRLEPFLSTLKKLIGDAPCSFVALGTLELLEVSPRWQHLSFFINAVKLWMSHFANDGGFWLDFGIGRRTCAIITKLQSEIPVSEASEAVLRDIEQVLAALVTTGVAEASQLELAFAPRN